MGPFIPNWTYRWPKTFGVRRNFAALGEYRLEVHGKARSRLFTVWDIGGAVAFRPFIGPRNSPSLSGTGPSSAFKIVAGIWVYKWM